jgi:hypothetical protein
VALFHFAIASKPTLGPTQPLIQRLVGSLIPAVKWTGHETDDESPSSTEVKYEWAWYLVWHKDNFTFNFNINISETGKLSQ